MPVPMTSTSATEASVNMAVMRSECRKRSDWNAASIVPEADEVKGVGSLEVVLVKADPEGAGDRVGHEQNDEDERRGIEQVGKSRVAELRSAWPEDLTALDPPVLGAQKPGTTADRRADIGEAVSPEVCIGERGVRPRSGSDEVA